MVLRRFTWLSPARSFWTHAVGRLRRSSTTIQGGSMFNRWRALAATALLAVVPVAVVGATAAHADGPLTLAVYGDSPYGRTAYAPGGQSGDTAEYEKSPA